MYYQRMGHLGQKLYRLGWQEALQTHHPKSLKHWSLSIFFYYRQGFKESSIQRVESCLTYK
jgi:hypothetical protein